MKPTRAVRTAPRAPFACGDPRRDTGHDPLAKPAQQPRYPLHRHRPQRRGKVGFTSAALRAHAAILPRRLGGRCAVEGTPARLPPIPVPVSLQPPPHALLPPGCPRPARHPDHLCAGDRRSDHASLIRGVASSRSLVSGLREHRPLTHAAGRGTMPMTVLGGALPVPCTRNPGYASLNARLRPVPVRTERRVMTPMVRVLVRRSPVNPVRSEEAAVSGQLRVPRGGLAGATTLATGGRVGTMRAHGHSHPCVTPPHPTPPTPHPASSGRVPTGHACECRS